MPQGIKTCVLGVGLAGLNFHVPFILALPDLFQLYAVLDRNSDSEGGKVKQRFGVTPRVYKTIEDVCADPNVQLIIVATPNDTHYAYTKAALSAGKHVLVDKPITPDFELANELLRLAEEKGLVLYPFQNRRWDSDYLALRRLLSLPKSDSRSLGDLVEFESHFDRYRNALKNTWKDKPTPAAGQLFDLGTHLIDQVLVLFGLPETVTAFVDNVRVIGSPEVDDNFTVVLRYPPGAVSPHPFTAILRSHILSVRKHQPRFVVRGTNGTYVKYGVDIQEDQLRSLTSPGDIHDARYGIEPEHLWGTLDTLNNDGSINTSVWPSTDPGTYVSLFTNLAQTIMGNTEQSVKWEESATVVRIIQLAHQSSREGRTIKITATKHSKTSDY